jgi:hypothetical protein
MIITLRYDSTCRDCGAPLAAGTKARWYKGGKTYGLDCHTMSAPGVGSERTAYERGDRSRGALYSHYDRSGVYAVDGTKLGSTCGCIDYPCCGH